MKKKVLLLLLAMVSVQMAWAKKSDPDPDPWVPSETYACWVHEFQVDKAYIFNDDEAAFRDDRPDDGVDVEDAPGMISFSVMSWHNRIGHGTENHNLDWLELSLYNSFEKTDYPIVRIFFNGDTHDTDSLPKKFADGDGSVKSMTHYGGNKTYFVQKRMHTQWNDGTSGNGAMWCYFVTQYNNQLRQFSESAGTNLKIHVKCLWRNSSQVKSYDETSDIVLVHSLPVAAPMLGTSSWLQKDGRLMLETQFQNLTADAETEIYLRSPSGTSIDLYPWSRLADGNVDLPLPAEHIQTPLLESRNMLLAQHRVVRPISQQHWRSGHGCTARSTIQYSDETDTEIPVLMQPGQIEGRSEGGKNILHWTIRPAASPWYDGGDLVVERSRTSNFAHIDMTDRVPYNPSQTEYSYEDMFPDRSQGDMTYHYRVRRDKMPAAASVNPTVSIISNTDYPTIKNLTVDGSGNSTATIRWELSNSGIHSENMDMQLTWGTHKEVLKLDTKSFTMVGLRACEPIQIRLDIREQGAAVVSSVTSYALPDSVAGRISSFALSKGFYSDHVDLRWTIDRDSANFAFFSIDRINIKDAEGNTNWDHLGVITHTSGLLNYSYSDQTCVAGEYYYYRINGYSTCGDVTEIQHAVYGVGFAQPYAAVSGQVTYNGGRQAVKNAKVSADNGVQSNRAAAFLDIQRDTVVLPELQEQVANPLKGYSHGTVEMWVKGDWRNDPDYHMGQTLIYAPTALVTDFEIALEESSELEGKMSYLYHRDTDPEYTGSVVAYKDGVRAVYNRLYLDGHYGDKNWRTNDYNLVSYTYSTTPAANDSVTLSVCMYVNGELIGYYNDTRHQMHTIALTEADSVYFGHRNQSQWSVSQMQVYQGQIVEVRMWNTVRTAEEIRANQHTVYDKAGGNLVFAYRKYQITETPSSAVMKPKDADGLLGASTGTIEMWLRPNQVVGRKQVILMRDSAYEWSISEQGEMSFVLRGADGRAHYHLDANLQDSAIGFAQPVYNHVAVSYEVVSGVLHMHLMVNGKRVVRQDYPAVSAAVCPTRSDKPLLLGTDTLYHCYSGYMDELRFWNVCRDSVDIAESRNGYLGGMEYGLTGYYRFDNEETGELYDISRTNTRYNERHMRCVGRLGIEKNIVPTHEQLSLWTRTDEAGNYLLNAIPYSKAGSRYTIAASLGIHEFVPKQRGLYFDANTPTQNNINFTDVSSFEVSGSVFYENTDYPVEGCTFMVDGVPCVENNRLCMTDANGRYSIRVPVGDHYIEIVKNGHVFAHGGRYPEKVDGRVSTYDFEGHIYDLDWTDQTLVTLTGRVAGGYVEKMKPYGMQQGKNNIGTAHIVISPIAKDKYDLNLSDSAVTYGIPEGCEVQSVARVEAHGGMASRHITIVTDSATGEFSVLVPPIDMSVDSIRIPTNDEIYFHTASIADLHLSQCDSMRYRTDTLVTKEGKQKTFRYLDALNVNYAVRPELVISQFGRKDGLFGVDSVRILNPGNDRRREMAPAIGRIGETDSIGYCFGVPVFLQDNTYSLEMLCAEMYVNYDKAEARVDTVPVIGSEIAVSNELGEPVNGFSNTFRTDSAGRGYYQFNGGMPNLTEPTAGQPRYRCHFSASYTNASGDMHYDWAGNSTGDAIVLGEVPMEGENFITEGPSSLIYVLRNAPGSNSMAMLSKGTTISQNYSYSVTNGGAGDGTLVIHAGFKVNTGTGFGFFVMNEFMSKDDITINVSPSGNDTKGTVDAVTYSLSEDISTQMGENYVGSNGDVYIGSSTNLNFSDVQALGVVRNDQTGRYELAVRQATSMTRKYNTGFAYSQYHLETVQLPMMRQKRNALLNNRITPEQYAYPDSLLQLDSTRYHYLTLLREDDPMYGEEGTYKAIPAKTTSGQNMVGYYNNEISTWKLRMAENERTKVMAQQNNPKYTKDNFSIDGGVYRSFTLTQSEGETASTNHVFHVDVSLKNTFGFHYNTLGFTGEIGGSYLHNQEMGISKEEEKSTTIMYMLGMNDKEQMSVEVVNGVDDFSPVFRLMGGQTYCPYEGEEKTKYYQPGMHVLTHGTQRMENPEIKVKTPEVSGIPTGGHALYELHLSNDVTTTNASNFTLSVNNTTNPHGAQLTVAGANITNTAMPVYMQPGSESTVLLELTQTDMEQLEYNDIELIFASECSPMLTSSSAKISAHFVAACPSVNMSVNRLMSNIENPKVQFRLTDYDCTVKTFRKIRLEYKRTSDADYMYHIAEFTRDTLAQKSVFVYTWDMSDLNDGEYEVRAVAVCQVGNEEIVYEGSPVTIIKDQTIPQTLGLPSPINGIYSSDNEVYVTYNEPLNTALIKESDVQVTGTMNGGELTTDIAYRLSVDGRMAETEAAYVLQSTPFSIEAWVRIDSMAEGTILSHNSDYRIMLTGEGKLKVEYTAGGAVQTAASTDVLPLHKWMYLCVQQEYTPGDSVAVIHAHCAYDAYEKELLNIVRRPYSGIGPMQVGADNHGEVSVCELQLWNTFRHWDTVKSTMYQSKELNRNELYGYWPMHEGEGMVAQDKMRHRHMVLPAESWRYKDTNRGLHISEGTSVKMNLGDKQIVREDYMIEFWFRRSTAGAIYECISDVDTTYVVLDEQSIDWNWIYGRYHQPLGHNYCDGEWHHLALIARTQSDSEVLIDGKPCLTMVDGTDASLIGHLYFSPDSTAMDIDEIRLWKSTITPDWAKQNRRNRVNPAASGLIAYYPMEDSLLADVATDTMYHHVSLESTVASVPLTRVNDGPAMVAVRHETTVPHSYTASDTRLVINLQVKPQQIEGQTLNFLVKGLPDRHNNLSKEVRWSAYVHRNLLEWDEQEMRVSKEVLDRTQVDVTFTNRSGSIESWTISGLPEWMSVSESSGSLSQLTTKTVTLTIDESLAIGHYEPVIYLSGNQGIYDALPLSIQVTGDRPNWQVNPRDFAYSMNIIGRVNMADGLTADTADLIAAKIGSRVVGLTHPQYTYYQGIPYVMMDVYANLNQAQLDSIAQGLPGPKVDFEYWDASTGLIHTDLETWLMQEGDPTPYSVRFKDGGMIGSMRNPLIFGIGNTIRQEINMVKGWNWYSFNVLPVNDTANVFLRPLIPYLSVVKSQDSYAEVDTVRQRLVGTLQDIKLAKMYRMKAVLDCQQKETGYSVNPTTIPLTLRPGWNWIGYVPNLTLSVDAALANLEAMEGDIIKGQRGFATYFDHHWTGSLRALNPGAGYMYYSNNPNNVVFYYPGAAASLMAPQRAAAAAALHYTAVDRSLYSGNMTITAIVKRGATDVTQTGLEVGVFAGEECRTSMLATDDRFYLTVPGDEAVELEFRIWDGESETRVSRRITFVNDAQYGSFYEPYVIQLDDETGLRNENETYDTIEKVIVNEMVYIVKNGYWFDILGHAVEKPAK